MKTIRILIFLTTLLTSVFVNAQNHALGFRLGDPSGLSYKRFSGNNALEINLGRTHIFSRSNWYYDRFDKWYGKQNFGYKDWKVTGYKASAPIGLQVHYLFRNGIDKVADEKTPGLEWYYGVGGQLRFQNYYYTYRYKIDGNPNWLYADGGRVSDFDIGADGVVGMEYKFKGAPISVFADITLFMEILDNPFLFHFQGGLGARYHF